MFGVPNSPEFQRWLRAQGATDADVFLMTATQQIEWYAEFEASKATPANMVDELRANALERRKNEMIAESFGIRS